MKINKQLIFSILLVLATFYLGIELYLFQILPSKYFFLIFIGIVCVDTLGVYLLYKFKGKVITILLTVVISVTSFFGGFYVSQANKFFTSVTKEIKTRNKVSLITKVSSNYKDIKEIEGLNIGILRSIGTEASSICLDELKQNDVHVNISKYDGLTSLIHGFYNNEVDGIIINESFRASVLDIEANFNDNTEVLFSSAYETEQETVANKVDDVTKYPFSILITGCDALQDLEQNSRSDVNMIVTVNPETQKVLILSIPRDYYVEMVCDASAGCPNGQLDKLTHSGMHGTETTKKTLEKLFNIEINYTVKVTFDTLIQLVDAVGGVDVFVEQGDAVAECFTNHSVSIKEGWNHLNGEQALAYSRERYAYLEGDRHRTSNARQVLISLINKFISTDAIKNYSKILDSLKNTFTTNMSADEIKALIQFQLDQNPNWDIQQYMVDGYGSMDLSPEFNEILSTMNPDYETVKQAKQLMRDIKDGK